MFKPVNDYRGRHSLEIKKKIKMNSKLWII